MYAAENIHIHVLKYPDDNQYLYANISLAIGAKNDHLEALKYLRANGCPRNKSDCRIYAKNKKHQHAVDWLNYN